MPEQDSRRIVREILDEPHVAGRRISVLTIYDRVEGAGLAPQTVADRLDVDIADVYHALAYYHEHLKEMQTLREERSDAFEAYHEAIDRPPGVSPDNE